MGFEITFANGDQAERHETGAQVEASARKRWPDAVFWRGPEGRALIWRNAAEAGQLGNGDDGARAVAVVRVVGDDEGGAR